MESVDELIEGTLEVVGVVSEQVGEVVLGEVNGESAREGGTGETNVVEELVASWKNSDVDQGDTKEGRLNLEIFILPEDIKSLRKLSNDQKCLKVHQI